MASVKTSSYGGRYLQLTVIEQSTSISANTSTVKWTLESIGGNVNYYTIHNCKVVVNGTTVYNPGTVNASSENFPAKKGSKSGTITVTHKADGTASPITFELHGKVYYSGDENKTGTLSLSTIPRAPSYNSVSASNITETSVTLSASIDSHGLSITSGGWDLSTDGGSTWEYYSGGTTNKTITGLQAGTKYWYRGYATSSGGSSNSNWNTFTTYSYPYATSMPNFNIGDSLTIQIYNPLSRTVTVNILGADDSVCTEDTFNGTTLSGYNNETCKNNFYASIPNSNNGTYKVKVTYGQIVTTKTGGTYYTKVNECSPTFSNFTYKDSNSSVVAVTGSNQIIVKGHSILNAVISSANKMIAQRSASASKYVGTCDTRNQAENYSSSDVTINLGTIENSGTLRLNVSAYDSRNNSTSVYKDIVVYDYTKPVINASAVRLNNFENQTTIQVNGTYSRLTVNGTDKNTITSVKYRYREVGGSWNSWTTINTTVVSGAFSCSDVVVSLDNTKAWEIEIKATDNLDSETIATSVDVGQAIFFISSNQKKCYINGNEIITPDSNNRFSVSHIRGTNSVEIPKSTTAGEGITNTDGDSLIQNKNNHTYVNATGDKLYLGNANTQGIDLLNGKLTRDSNGNVTSNVDMEKIGTGGMYPKADQTINLTKNVSKCEHGILLHWQFYSGGQVQNANHVYTFIPKYHTKLHNGTGVFCLMGGTEGITTFKYVYVYDDKITGHNNNLGNRTYNGVTYNNSLFVLSEVLAV